MKFCPECGTAVTARCPNCGAEHAPGQKFCAECGQPLGGVATTPVPAAPAVIESAELRLVSVLFVDLVGFTALSESREAEDVRELLGRYFDSARTIVERYGGTVEKFIGDAVMAVWGVPLAREDDAERAVRAALDVVDAVNVFGAEVGAPDLRARAGVVTGQVAALENPGEGLVVGDRVNTASRVQSAAQPGSVFVDEVTRQVTSAAIAYEEAGDHEVKGKAEPLRLWRALRVVAGVGGAERAQGFEAPFVGRDADLRLLKELFHAAQERRSARLVAVSGEAGTGKSRLLREFFKYMDGLSSTVLWHSGRCPSYGEGVAYWALAEMVRQRFGIPEDAPGEEGSEKLTAGLVRWVPDAADREFLMPRLGALLGLAEPGLSREELFAGWRLFFERLAEHEPVVLVFEDMQWADDGLLDFISQLLDWSAQSPIFMLTLARPELGVRRQGWPAGLRGATLLGLEPLEDAAMRALLDGVVDELPPAAGERIVAQAEGVPLYAVETLRALVDRGVLEERDGRLALVGELGELDVPASLGSLLAARIDALEPAERQLVKAMSVFGGSFPRASAAALGEVDEGQLDEVLASLVRKQVLAIRADRLSPDRGQYVFAQGLLRTVAYEMLSRQERKARHLAAAEHLREAFPNEGEEVAEAVATHLLDAHRAAQGDPDADEICAQAVVALRRAAQRAATVGAPETAERTYLTARDLVSSDAERVELTELAAEMAIHSGRYDAALTLLEEATEAHSAAGEDREAARTTGRVGYALTRLGRNDEAAARISAALDVLGADRLDAEVGELNAHLGFAYAFVGEYDKAHAALERALQIGTDLQLIPLLTRALNTKVVIYVYLGRVVECRALLGTAIELAEQHSLSEELARAQNNSGNLAMQWDLPEAAEHLETSLTLARRRGARFLEGIAAGNLVTLHIYQGRWDEAERLIAELLTDAEEIPGRDILRQGASIIHALRGDTDQAQAHLDKLSGWAASEDVDLHATYSSLTVIVSLGAGRAEEALSTAIAALPLAIEGIGAASDPVRLGWPIGVRAALELERFDDLRRLIGLLTDAPPGRVPPYLRAELSRAQGLIAAAEGRHQDAEAQLTDAIDRLRELGYPYHLALAQTDLARWLIAQERGGEATELLGEAIGTFERLGAQPALDRALALRGAGDQDAAASSAASSI